MRERPTEENLTKLSGKVPDHGKLFHVTGQERGNTISKLETSSANPKQPRHYVLVRRCHDRKRH